MFKLLLQIITTLVVLTHGRPELPLGYEYSPENSNISSYSAPLAAVGPLPKLKFDNRSESTLSANKNSSFVPSSSESSGSKAKLSGSHGGNIKIKLKTSLRSLAKNKTVTYGNSSSGQLPTPDNNYYNDKSNIDSVSSSKDANSSSSGINTLSSRPSTSSFKSFSPLTSSNGSTSLSSHATSPGTASNGNGSSTLSSAVSKINKNDSSASSDDFDPYDIESIIHKHVYLNLPPPEFEEDHRQVHVKLPPKQKHYKIIFIEAPVVAVPTIENIPRIQPDEEKTLVYVLSKMEQSDIQIPMIVRTKPSKPEVYFVGYTTQDKEPINENTSQGSEFRQYRRPWLSKRGHGTFKPNNW
ncbi:hypothetical protein NQ318_006710 [Aromia moschata]|uniref:DUF243 domain-containing protein n=1 Tax=Aromia moschata TaxID=1265417 RepID=A0AAV8YDB4_9CUCU|nr:hypothetical protein NQ318_006710 [Aromia moschata]